jgi:hypothetical protein
MKVREYKLVHQRLPQYISYKPLNLSDISEHMRIRMPNLTLDRQMRQQPLSYPYRSRPTTMHPDPAIFLVDDTQVHALLLAGKGHDHIRVECQACDREFEREGHEELGGVIDL